MGTALACSICGGSAFTPGFGGRIANGVMPRCDGCSSVERHRIVHALYQPLKPLLKDWRVLQYAPDVSLDPEWFGSFRGSVYGGETSLDMMRTGLDDASFDLVVSNHVLEHVEDDRAALRESLRVVGEAGVVHVCVPAPTYRWETSDWGFADPHRNFHYRDYGADFPQRVLEAIVDVKAVAVAGFDRTTHVCDLIYFFSASAKTLSALAGLWCAKGIPVVPVGFRP